MPDAAQRQLSDALTYISQSDFPDKWPTLMPELVSKLASPDVKVLVPRVPSPLLAKPASRPRHHSVDVGQACLKSTN